MSVVSSAEEATKIAKDNGWFWCVKGEWTNCDPMNKKLMKK